MRFLISLACLVFFSLSTQAQISLPKEIKSGQFPFVVIEAETKGELVRWIFDSKYLQTLPLQINSPKSIVIMLSKQIPKGRYKVWAYTAIDGKPTLPAWTEIIVGEDPEPGPEPGPGPDPEPEPEPGPAPIPEAGFRVLIVYESADTAEYPKGQVEVLYAKKIREYLDQKCKVGPDGKTKEWRIWDKDVAASADSAMWAKVMERPRQSLPWIVISTGKSGFEGPLPKNVDETLSLLKKYGG